MKKLRKEVKEILLIGFGLVIILVAISLLNSQKDKAVNQCVNAGHDYNYCERGLR